MPIKYTDSQLPVSLYSESFEHELADDGKRMINDADDDDEFLVK